MSVAVNYQHIPAYKYVINHDIMNCTADGVVGNHLYSGRALAISEPWDIIQLHSELRPLWPDITSHYQRIGLSYSENVLWNISPDQLGSHAGFHPSVFYFGPEEYRYWGDQEWLESVEYINSKNNFMALAGELGVDIPKTLCFDSVTDISKAALEEMSYPCYLKAAISVSGVGIYRCETEDGLIQAMEKFDKDTPVQIQEEVIAESFLNLQYRVEGNELVRLAASEQILDGFVHQGNRAPSTYEPWDSVEPMAEWLKERGIKGIFAFDVAITQTDSGLRFPAIECNPRFNGASYPTLIAHKLGIPSWTAMTFSTRHRNISSIDLRDIEFDSKTGQGVVFVNWGTVLEGKIVLLLAGPREVQDALATEIESRM